jgi:type VI protein secretion system component Hcp
MERGIVGRTGSRWIARAVTSAAVAALALAAAGGASAAAAKAKRVIVGQLVLGGAASDIADYAWEVTAASTFTSGGAAVGKPNPGAIRFTKWIDASSVSALLKIAVGTAFPSAVFTVTFGKGKDASTMVYELEDLFVTRVGQGSIDGVVTEELSFVFKAVTWTFTSATGDVTTGSWDVVSGAAS